MAIAIQKLFQPPADAAGRAVVEGSRVRLLEETDDLPVGALGTVTGVYPHDDTVLFVQPDLRPFRRLRYLDYEIPATLEVV